MISDEGGSFEKDNKKKIFKTKKKQSYWEKDDDKKATCMSTQMIYNCIEYTIRYFLDFSRVRWHKIIQECWIKSAIGIKFSRWTMYIAFLHPHTLWMCQSGWHKHTDIDSESMTTLSILLVQYYTALGYINITNRICFVLFSA